MFRLTILNKASGLKEIFKATSKIMFKLGEVKMPSDQDFSYVKDLCENHAEWELEYSKTNLKVWVKNSKLSSFRMIKVKAELDEVKACNLFDVMLDGDYSKIWDESMLDAFQICYLSPCSDITYYSMKSPKPLKNRDFVVQRCWLDFGDGHDKIVFNHSINHAVILKIDST